MGSTSASLQNSPEDFPLKDEATCHLCDIHEIGGPVCILINP